MREEVKIGETTFFVEKFPALLQIKIFGDLQKTLLPSFGKALSGLTADDEDKSVLEAQFIDGVRELSQQLDGDSLMKLTETLLRAECIAFQRDDHNNGNDTKLSRDKINVAFDGMDGIVELLIFVLKLNFAPFFSKYLGRLGLGQKLTTK